MRRTWPYLIGVAFVSALVGVVIAGRPASPDTFVVRLDQVSTTVASLTTASPTTTETSAPPTLAVTTTEAPPTSLAAPNPASAPATSGPTATPTIVAALRAPGVVRVVVVNAAATDGLATETADRLAQLGYLDVAATTAQGIQDTSVVYYRPGFEREARRLLTDLRFEASSTVPLNDLVVSDRDAEGDLIVVLGTGRRPA